MTNGDKLRQRHGHWIWLEPYGALFTHRRKCSECGDIKAQEESNFCPNCGARMDADETAMQRAAADDYAEF